MITDLSPELYWLTLSALLTSLLWIPHILRRIVELGPYEAFRDPKHEVETQAPWAQRAIRAHTNAIENLAVFGVLVLIVHYLSLSTALTAFAAMAYFYSRLGHYIVYILGVPWIRTPLFLIGFGSQIILAFTILRFI